MMEILDCMHCGHSPSGLDSNNKNIRWYEANDSDF